MASRVRTWVLALTIALAPAWAQAAGRAERLALAVRAIEAGDDGVAVAALARLSQEGSAVAETLLGAMRAAGRGGPRDRAAAAAHWLRAAQRGYPPAQLALARAFAAGEGVRRDPAEVYRWALIAQGHGDPPLRAAASALARRARAGIDPATAARAERRARSWRPWGAIDG